MTVESTRWNSLLLLLCESAVTVLGWFVSISLDRYVELDMLNHPRDLSTLNVLTCLCHAMPYPTQPLNQPKQRNHDNLPSMSHPSPPSPP